MVKNLLVITKPVNSTECTVVVFIETMLQLCKKHSFVLMKVITLPSLCFVYQLNYYTVKILLCIS